MRFHFLCSTLHSIENNIPNQISIIFCIHKNTQNGCLWLWYHQYLFKRNLHHIAGTTSNPSIQLNNLELKHWLPIWTTMTYNTKKKDVLCDTCSFGKIPKSRWMDIVVMRMPPWRRIDPPRPCIHVHTRASIKALIKTAKQEHF